jgi:hypothetical protein
MAVLASIRGATGTIEQRDAQITRSGMYAEYPAIIRGYIELESEDEAVRLESLKRALFLVWYSFTVASTESGISELAESVVREVMSWLERHVGHGDDELRMMVAWYRDTFGYPFDFFGPVRGLDAWISDTSSSDARAVLARSSWRDRGQLGLYWTSVLAAGAT